MKRVKNSYMIAMLDVPADKTPRPVFVQGWTFKDALRRGSHGVMQPGVMHAKLKVTRLRQAKPFDHAWNPWKIFYVNRQPVIRSIVPA